MDSSSPLWQSIKMRARDCPCVVCKKRTKFNCDVCRRSLCLGCTEWIMNLGDGGPPTWRLCDHCEKVPGGWKICKQHGVGGVDCDWCG